MNDDVREALNMAACIFLVLVVTGAGIACAAAIITLVGRLVGWWS